MPSSRSPASNLSRGISEVVERSPSQPVSHLADSHTLGVRVWSVLVCAYTYARPTHQPRQAQLSYGGTSGPRPCARIATEAMYKWPPDLDDVGGRHDHDGLPVSVLLLTILWLPFVFDRFDRFDRSKAKRCRAVQALRRTARAVVRTIHTRSTPAS